MPGTDGSPVIWTDDDGRARRDERDSETLAWHSELARFEVLTRPVSLAVHPDHVPSLLTLRIELAADRPERVVEALRVAVQSSSTPEAFWLLAEATGRTGIRPLPTAGRRPVGGPSDHGAVSGDTAVGPSWHFPSWQYGATPILSMRMGGRWRRMATSRLRQALAQNRRPTLSDAGVVAAAAGHRAERRSGSPSQRDELVSCHPSSDGRGCRVLGVHPRTLDDPTTHTGDDMTRILMSTFDLPFGARCGTGIANPCDTI